MGADVFVLPSQAGSTVCRLLSGRQAQLILLAYTAAVIVQGVGKSRGNATAVPGRERDEREVVVVVERDKAAVWVVMENRSRKRWWD